MNDIRSAPPSLSGVSIGKAKFDVIDDRTRKFDTSVAFPICETPDNHIESRWFHSNVFAFAIVLRLPKYKIRDSSFVFSLELIYLKRKTVKLAIRWPSTIVLAGKTARYPFILLSLAWFNHRPINLWAEPWPSVHYSLPGNLGAGSLPSRSKRTDEIVAAGIIALASRDLPVSQCIFHGMLTSRGYEHLNARIHILRNLPIWQSGISVTCTAKHQSFPWKYVIRYGVQHRSIGYHNH
jgi:hypothetical protein